LPVIKLSRDNLVRNIDIIKQKVISIDKIAFVLKDNAYGHGIKEIANILKQQKISRVIVKNLQEAEIVVDDFSFVLVLCDIPDISVAKNIHIVVNSLCDIENTPANTNIHIKVDTGMHRNGIAINELKNAVDMSIKRGLNICGVMTHHRSADVLGSEFFWQNRLFDDVKKETISICKTHNIKKPMFHSLNSAGVLRSSEIKDDIVRVGIALYGYCDIPSSFGVHGLIPVMSLWAKKISTRTIQKNDRLGYGGAYIASKDMIISSYDIGYGDGFLRLDESCKYRCRDGENILGRVSMNSTIINSDKDSICIFDDVQELARLHNTISYEIITTLSSGIKRVVC
jgi:alanine racemase